MTCFILIRIIFSLIKTRNDLFLCSCIPYDLNTKLFWIYKI